jgi:hypothetical protein
VQPSQRQLRSIEPADVRRAVDDELWRRGVLLRKLHASQRGVYALIVAAVAAGAARFVLEIARRWGKTWLLVCIAVETAIRKPGCRIVYGAPTLKDLQEFIIPTIEAITADAPEGLRWRFNSQTMHFTCENGSYLHLFGCDDKRKANRGRGPGAVLVILDECGFIPILRYVIQSVLRPQLLHSGGAMLLGSTPAEEPDHDFTQIAERAEANGNFAKRTIYDNDLLTQEKIAAFIAADAKDEGMTPEEYKGTDTFRREYLAERVVNKLLVVLPEWEEKRDVLRRPMERPEFYDAMTVLDPGGNDPHAVSFGYWHFAAAKYVQEDELLLRDGENTEDLAARVKTKERELWGVSLWDGTLRAVVEDETGVLSETVPEWMQDILSAEARPQPYARFMDINVALARDLYQLHRVAFLNTAKDDKAAAVNNLRVALRREEYVLHPRCVHTDRHFRQTTWRDAKRNDYARKAGEHGDLVDTAVYGMRNVNRQKNPFPKGWNVLAGPNTAAAMAEARRETSGLPPLRVARLRRR